MQPLYVLIYSDETTSFDVFWCEVFVVFVISNKPLICFFKEVQDIDLVGLREGFGLSSVSLGQKFRVELFWLFYIFVFFGFVIEITFRFFGLPRMIDGSGGP